MRDRTGTNNSFYGRRHTELTRAIISYKNRQRIGKARGGAPKGVFHRPHDGSSVPWNKGMEIVPRVQRKCNFCGNPYQTLPKRNLRFCSALCRTRFAIGKRRGRPPWNKGKSWSSEVRQKISERTKGRQWSETARAKVGQTIQRLYQEGKMVHADFSGEKNPNWKGGIKFAPYHANFNYTARRLVRERDNFTCALCGSYGKQVHHVDGDKGNPHPRLITLCNRCHTTSERNPDKYRSILLKLWEERTFAS